MDKSYRLPIRTWKHRRVYYNQIIISEYLKQMETLSDKFNTLNFAEMMMKTTPKLEFTKTSIEAQEYIKNTDEIDKESIKQLYDILSREDLKIEEIKAMGKYYRKNLEFITTKSSFLVKPVGPNPEDIDKYMDKLIEFIQNEKIDFFIKSQIIGLYLLYIHPYPNLNGRMSRMLSSWYLLKKQKYSCIVFNRIPSYKPFQYSKSIKSIYKHGDITPFLTFSIKETKSNLEKMQTMERINKYNKAPDLDTFKLLEYLLMLDNPNIESLARINHIQNRYISTQNIKEKLNKYLKNKIIIEENNTYHINEKIITK